MSDEATGGTRVNRVVIGWVIALVATLVIIRASSAAIPEDDTLGGYSEGRGLEKCVELARRHTAEAAQNNRIAWIAGAFAIVFGIIGGILGPETPGEHDGWTVRYIKHAQGVVWLPLSGVLVMYMNYRLDRQEMSAQLAGEAIEVVARHPRARARTSDAAADRASFEACMASRARWEQQRTLASGRLREHFKPYAEHDEEKPLEAAEKLAIETLALAESFQRLHERDKGAAAKAREELESDSDKLLEAKRNPATLRAATTKVVAGAIRLQANTSALRETTQDALEQAKSAFAKTKAKLPPDKAGALATKLEAATKTLDSKEKDDLATAIVNLEDQAQKKRLDPEALALEASKAREVSSKATEDYTSVMNTVADVSKELAESVGPEPEVKTGDGGDTNGR